MPHLFGAHTIDAGGIHMAVRRAANGGMRALQIFTAIPRFYNERVSVRPERAERFRVALADSPIEPAHVVAHGAYVLNVATPEEAKWVRARDGLTKELERATTLGIGAVCFHPGAATDGYRDAAAKRIASAIVHALEMVKGETLLLVENTAGAGNTMARTAAEIGAILANVPRTLRARTGYGLDTCHLYASGYDLAASPERVTAILDEFEEATGSPPGFFHLNDSEGALGSNRDRHALIGDGALGIEPFRWLLADPRTQNVPLIFETPQLYMEPDDGDDAPDPYDVQMMVLAEQLIARQT